MSGSSGMAVESPGPTGGRRAVCRAASTGELAAASDRHVLGAALAARQLRFRSLLRTTTAPSRGRRHAGLRNRMGGDAEIHIHRGPRTAPEPTGPTATLRSTPDLIHRHTGTPPTSRVPSFPPCAPLPFRPLVPCVSGTGPRARPPSLPIPGFRSGPLHPRFDPSAISPASLTATCPNASGPPLPGWLGACPPASARMPLRSPVRLRRCGLATSRSPSASARGSGVR